MDYRMKYMMNEGLILLSYAYAVSGYIRAAAVLGIFSAFLAVILHSGNSFLNNLPKIAAGTLIQLPFISVSVIPGYGYVTVLLAFCNTAVSLLWMESSFKAIRPTIRILSMGFPVFLLLSLVLPEAAAYTLTGSLQPRTAAVMLDMLIFLPAIGGYLYKTLRRRRISVGLGRIL